MNLALLPALALIALACRVGAEDTPPPLRVGIISFETSHVPAFTPIFNDSKSGVDLEKTPLTLGPNPILDGEKEQFLDNPAANGLLTREYRKPFEVPEESKL